MEIWNEIKTIFFYLMGIETVPRPKKTVEEKLLMSMRVTAKCRFNASVRLKQQGKFSQLSTTLLSLGLIFIPLMQNSDISLTFQPKVLNMMQIFLAVSVLVYSVVMSKANYELKAEKLNDCGVNIKELIRKFDYELNGSQALDVETLKKFQGRYSDITADTEGHNRIDYLLATLEMKNDYCITGFKRLILLFYANIKNSFVYIVPASFVLFEIIFITDMIGVSNLLPSTFK